MDPPLGGDYGVRQVYVETLHGTFASLEVRFPGWVFDLIAVGSLVPSPDSSPRGVARRRARSPAWRESVLFAGLAFVIVLSLHVVAFRLLRVDPSDPIIVGRYLLPLVAPAAVAIASP